MCVCVCVCVCIIYYRCVCVYVCVCACVCVYIYRNICIFIYISIRMYMNIYIYIYTSTNSQHTHTIQAEHKDVCSLKRPPSVVAFARDSFCSRPLYKNLHYHLQTPALFGHPALPFIAHTIAQYSVAPRPSCIAIPALQYW